MRVKALYLEAGHLNNEEGRETKGGAHDTKAFLVDEEGKVVPLKVKDQRGAARTSEVLID